MSNTKQITLSDTYGISKEWLDVQIIILKEGQNNYPNSYAYKGAIDALETVQSQLFPIEPIFKDFMGESYDVGRGASLKSEQEILSQPITIKLEENGK